MAARTTPKKKAPTPSDLQLLRPQLVSIWNGALHVRAGAIDNMKTLRISARSAAAFANQAETGREVFSHDKDSPDLDRLPANIYERGPAGDQARLLHGVVPVHASDLSSPGKAKSLIGYAYAPAGSSTLWLFVMDSAAESNLPDFPGDESGIGRNAFTEMVIGAAMALYRSGSTKLALRFAFWSRYDRKEVFSSRIRQVARMNPGMTLWTGSQEVDLHSSGGQLTNSMNTGISGVDMVDLKTKMFIGRVNRLRSNLWDRAESLLPYGYRFETETYPSGRVEVKKGVVVADEGCREVLVELVQMAADGVAWHVIGRRAGELGVPIRSPRLAKRGGTLADLPDFDESRAAAAMGLVGNPRYIELWRTGSWVVRRVSMLDGALNLRDYPLEFEPGALRGHIDTVVDWPLPDAGWGVSDEVWDKLLARLASTQRRSHGSSDSPRRPLSGMGDWTEEEGKWQYRFAADSSTAYRLRRRPAEAGLFDDGRPRGWRTLEGEALGTFYAPTLHRALSKALEDALVRLVEGGTELGPLPVAPRQTNQRDLGQEDRAASLDDAANELDSQAAGLDKMALAATLGGNDQSSEVYIAQAEDCRVQAASTRQDAVNLRAAQVVPAPEVVVDEAVELDLASPALVAGALRRYPQQAPAVLAVALGTLGITGSFRIQLDRSGVVGHWTATCAVPVIGSEDAVAIELSGTVPNTRWVGDSGATTRRPQVVTDDVLRLLLVDNQSLTDVAQSIGATECWTRRQAAHTLRARGVSARNLRFAILDCPIPETRRVVFAHCVGDDTLVRDLDPGFVAHIVKVYFGDTGWGVSWTPYTWRIQRRLMATLLSAPGGQATKKLLASALGVSPRQLATRCMATGRRLCLVEQASAVAIRPVACPHPDCAAAAGSASHVLATPETAGGLLCPDCRRTPGDSVVVFPAGYLELWEGPEDGETTPTKVAAASPTAAVLIEEAMLTVRQAAEILRCSDYQVRTYIDPDERMGKVRLYRRATVEAKRQQLTRGGGEIPVMLTIGQAAERLGVPEWRVRKLVDRGAVGAERHFGWRFIDEDCVQAIGALLTVADTDTTLLGIGEAARRVGTTPFLLRRAADEGEIECVMSSGGSRKFSEEAVASYAAARGGELSTAGAAEFLGVSTDTVRHLEVEGLLKPSFITPGGHRRFTEVALDGYIADYDVLTVGEVAEKLQISKRSVGVLAEQGLLMPSYITTGGRRKWRRGDVDAYLTGASTFDS